MSKLAVENDWSLLLSRTINYYPIRYEVNTTYSSAHWLAAVEPIRADSHRGAAAHYGDSSQG